MEHKEQIYSKLENFIKKFYKNELLKGLIFFFSIGLLYFLFTILLEHFLWLGFSGRAILFWLFISVEIILLSRFILFPIFKLFKLQKGIDYNEASKIIGNHFSSINDKLLNFLQLSTSENQSELALASIDQKAISLKPFKFNNAVNFKSNVKHLPWLIIPVLFFSFFVLSGNTNLLSESLERVVRYNKDFIKPAPFYFKILNNNLNVEQGTDFILKVNSVGNIIPDNAKVSINNETYFLQKTAPGVFEYTFSNIQVSTSFYIQANNISSKDYTLSIIKVPLISNFEMVLNFPSHTKKSQEIVTGNGNAIVPEGTTVTWKIKAENTSAINWTNLTTNSKFALVDNYFVLSKRISNNIDYQVLTSNKLLKNYEKLNYQINVVKDQFPSIVITEAPKEANIPQNTFVGQLSDDYGLLKLQIVYYNQNNETNTKKVLLPIKSDLFDQFAFSFPGNLKVEEGVEYKYYFEVFDNDVVNGYKSSKSALFSNRITTQEELKEKQLKDQNAIINSLEKSILNQDKQLSELEKLQKLGKEKNELDFKDKQKINNFIERQKAQENMMKEFSKKLEKNLSEFQPEKKDDYKDELQERLSNFDKESDKNKKLLEELQRLTEKLNQTEIKDKLDKLNQKFKTQTKNLEQLVELTKRFYVEQKASELSDKLSKLSEKQEKLSNAKDENTLSKQEEINKNFKDIQEELKDLEKENNNLKKPLDIPSDKEKEENINSDLNKASEELKNNSKDKAQPKQKGAAQKMKQLSAKMEQNISGAQTDQLQEDIVMLRQILDNLLAYSFSQENVMNQFKSLKKGAPSYNKNLIIQHDLKQQFKHIDDSIFALSLRNPKVADFITEEVGNVHYNLDKAIDDLSQAVVFRGVSHQQYAVSSANKLADFLTNLLNNMQMSMSMCGSGAGNPKPGSGQGEKQLPDIIKKQDGLAKKMEEGIKEGEKPGNSKEGSKPGESKPGKGESGDGKSADGEQNAKELMEIYKEQNRLRQQLQDALQKEGLTPGEKKLLDQIKDVEKQILNKGFKNEVLQKMLNIKHELLKLENALQQQGEDEKRKSDTNLKNYNNAVLEENKDLKEFLNSIEILNRQTLPLRPVFNNKVQTYFKSND